MKGRQELRIIFQNLSWGKKVGGSFLAYIFILPPTSQRTWCSAAFLGYFTSLPASFPVSGVSPTIAFPVR